MKKELFDRLIESVRGGRQSFEARGGFKEPSV